MSDEKQNDEGREAQDTWEDIKVLRRTRAAIVDKLSDQTTLQNKLRETDEALNGKIRQLMEMLQPAPLLQTEPAALPVLTVQPPAPQAAATPKTFPPRFDGSPLLRRLVSAMAKSNRAMTVQEVTRAAGLKPSDVKRVYSCLRYNSLSASAVVKKTADGRYALT